jgi:tetratricopeptide (TPR) repeat protein
MHYVSYVFSERNALRLKISQFIFVRQSERTRFVQASMTSDTMDDESDMNPQVASNEIICTDIESYRKLVKKFIDLRRYKSALFWNEKVAVLSKNDPRDVYQLAQCMFMLKEFNRASHVIKKSALEKKNLMCLSLLVECLYASNDYQEALNLLTTLDIEDLNLNTSLHDETDETNQTNDTLRNVS